MTVVSDKEGENFEEKARRGQDIMDSLHKLSSKPNKTEEEKQKISGLVHELNKINEWFQKTAKY